VSCIGVDVVFSAKRSKGQKIVFVQKIIVFGHIRRHNVVFVVKSAGVTQRSIPKWVDERTSRKFHSMALGTLQDREALHEFREGGVSVLAGKFDVETGVEKEQPVTVVFCEHIPQSPIYLSERNDMADVQVGHDSSKDEYG
jgi:hypothetical protein